MKRHLLVVVAALLAALALAVPSPGAQSGLHHWTVTTFPETFFAESLALGPDGNLYASLTGYENGQIVRVRPATGAQQPYGPEFGVTSFLTGVAFDARGRLYVAEVRYSDDFSTFHGVVDRVDPHGVTEIATLPEGAFPNGLAFHDGYLYASDSLLGAIWRVRPQQHGVEVTTPWLQSSLLDPVDMLGANGIAFSGDRLYVVVADTGLVARTTVGRNGSPGPLRPLLQDDRLISGDGIAFDRLGGLWITTNGPVSGGLFLLTPAGTLVTIADQPAWLDYPTQPVFGPFGTLFVENGSFDNGTANIVALGIR